MYSNLHVTSARDVGIAFCECFCSIFRDIKFTDMKLPTTDMRLDFATKSVGITIVDSLFNYLLIYLDSEVAIALLQLVKIIRRL
jgi:hypothetical protein